MKIACLGTSANPPHLGHLIVAQKILQTKLVDQIWIIPCRKHVFNKPLLAWRHRWYMTKLLENKNIKACDLELKICKKDRPNFTLDTIKALKNKYKKHQFYWIIGSDIIAKGEYKKWHNWSKLQKVIQFIVIRRPKYKLSKNIPKCFIDSQKTSNSSISSTKIRQRLTNNLSIKKLVSHKIAQYLKCLKKNNLLKYKS